jgi:F420-dependent methylenetetrahydromethanopterin dehydrogenase
MVTWHGTEAARIRELFGTTTLPTAFTANADGIRVRTEIEKRNPGYVVTFA